MADWFTPLLTAKKLARKPLAVVALVAGVSLFSPDAFLQMLRLDAFLDEYGALMGAAFLGSSALLVLDGGHAVWTWLRAKQRESRARAVALQRL